MRRLILISIPLLLIAAVLVLLITNRGSSGDIKIKVSPGTKITRVVLEKKGERITLEERKGNWYLNDKEEVRSAAVSFLLAALEEIEPRSPLSESLFEELAGKFPENPVSVKVFSGKKRVRSFIVFHFNDPDYGSVIRKDSKSKPYLFYLPGYDFDAANVFTTAEDYWRPFSIFELMPSKISKVVFDYNGEPGKSFVLINNSGVALLQGEVSFDTVAVKRYLSYFVKIPFESVTTGLDPMEEKKILESQPYFSLTVTTTDGKSQTLRGWKRISGSETDTDRLWGRKDEGKLFVMRYLDIDPLLKKRSYFLVSK